MVAWLSSTNTPFIDRGGKHGNHTFSLFLTSYELVVGDGFTDFDGFDVVVGLIGTINPEESLAGPLPIDRVVNFDLPVVLHEVNRSVL